MASDNTITPAEFKVDLAQLADAIVIVGARKDSITNEVSIINGIFQQAESCWTGPAGTSFASFQAEFTQDMLALNDLLAEMVTRMTAAHDQYVQVEEANTANFQTSKA
ncbi:WXG100 family type VII secretion target [Kitasatospora sp. MAP12-15]|uniref:WXG100 family type VII secretion target n=1 Tax=unclassified Kitasatospora TaxID=2633591 RepID=UPI0024735EA3|nr:WXG100 family type VII secretion target [Kitasatospora sp. MAP12-44]MDH6109461.1 WXG100 family type VII secretion target [Kitasatospora sp. MAP12-44]